MFTKNVLIENIEDVPSVTGYLILVVSLFVIGCGIEELASSVPADLSNLRRPSSPNTYLAGPLGFVPTPDFQPRMTALVFDGDKLRADYAARSLVFGFPDILLTQVLPTGDGKSALVLYSYSLKGYYDFGVNRRRVTAILAGLNAASVRSR